MTIEGVLGGDIFNNTIYDQDTCDGKTQCNNTILFTASNTTFDLGLVGGYQHYFGDSQRHGIKVSAHVYSGFGNSWESSSIDPMTYEKVTGTVSYIPVKFGFDVKYLWDFLEIGKHTLGLNVGLGYEFDSYINGKTKQDYYSNNLTDLDNIFLNSFYPVIGLHYYYGHHQFELMYRFGGIIDEAGNKQVYYDSYPIAENMNNLTSTISYNVSLLNESYLTINYTYRF